METEKKKNEGLSLGFVIRTSFPSVPTSYGHIPWVKVTYVFFPYQGINPFLKLKDKYSDFL